jgi:hypothetical protein
VHDVDAYDGSAVARQGQERVGRDAHELAPVDADGGAADENRILEPFGVLARSRFERVHVLPPDREGGGVRAVRDARSETAAEPNFVQRAGAELGVEPAVPENIHTSGIGALRHLVESRV